MSINPDEGITGMMWAALKDSTTDLFMHAPIEEVTRHLAREMGDDDVPDVRDVRPAGFPSSFSFDPTSIARPAPWSRGPIY